MKIKNSKETISFIIAFKNGRLIGIKVSFAGETIWFINLYAPNVSSNRKAFFQECFHLFHEHVLPGEGIVLAGDFNTVLNCKKDKNGGITKDGNDAFYLRNQIFSKNFINIWRVRNPEAREFTHEQSYPCFVQSRIDFVLLSEWLNDFAKNKVILGRFMSDHNAVYLKFEFKAAKKGKGIWKLNNSLLQDDVYRKNVISLINDLKEKLQLKKREYIGFVGHFQTENKTHVN